MFVTPWWVGGGRQRPVKRPGNKEQGKEMFMFMLPVNIGAKPPF